MADIKVASPMDTSPLGGGSGAAQKPLTVASPMGDMGSNMMGGPGVYDGDKSNGFGAHPRTPGHGGPPEKVYEAPPGGTVSVKSPMEQTAIPRKP